MRTKDAIEISKKCKQIDGWLSREAVLLIALIDEVQKKNEFKGDAFEIGVHHGKSAVLFTQLLRDNEFLDVCDIFGDQEKNKSNSGNGNKDIFLSNIKNHGKEKIRHTFEMLSNELANEELKKCYRLFHIDGGHDTDEALFDLNLASEVLTDEGVIILDDPFRQDWPGVTEALVHFLEHHRDFIAIAVGFNKLMICKEKVAECYYTMLDDESMRKEYKLHYPIVFEHKRFAGGTMRVYTIKNGLNMRSIKVGAKRMLKS